MVFQHSVKVPTQYKKATKVLKKCTEESVSIKTLIYNARHADINKLYALISKILQRKTMLDQIIEESEILKIETRMDPYMCRILIGELLFGAKKLNGTSKPVQVVLSYEKKLQEIFKKISSNENNQSSSQVNSISNPRYVRINSLKVKPKELLENLANEGWRRLPPPISYDEYLKAIITLEPDQFIDDFHVNNLFAFPTSSKRYWATNSLVADSTVLLQDKASCLAPILLNPPKKSVILDMCAAPGLKTIHMAALIKNKGKIYAIEKHRNRFETMRKFVENSKATCVQMIEGDVLRIKDRDVPNVEYILLDPSCSGSGIVQRIPSEEDKESQSQERIEKLSRLQLKMLSHALNEFPAVKRVVYSTCSIHPEENEQVVQKALKQFKSFKLVNPIELLKNEWRNFGAASYKKIGKKCIYARPEIDFTNGFFIAVIERKEPEKKLDENCEKIQENI